jgi:molybdopterin converting factor small subunit
VRVRLASPLRSYVDQRDEVEAEGATLVELFADLDRRYPGLRFRVIDEQGGIRPHLRVFVNRVAVRDLDVALGPDDEVHVLQSLSGG